MNSANTKLKSFGEIFQHCKDYFAEENFTKKIHPEGCDFANIIGVINTKLEEFSHFEIIDYNSKYLGIEFHVEKAEKTKRKRLQTAIKYWKGIDVFDKRIEYDQKGRNNRGRLRIKCSYSEGAEKILAYLYEFIYQVKSRIENLYPELYFTKSR